MEDPNSSLGHMNSASDHMSSYAEAAALYGYEDRISSEVQFQKDSFPQGPGSPLPADRLARKQRVFNRRGGACHSALLHSAVMACMSSPKDDDDKPSFSVMDTSAHHDGPPSPRKRLRRSDKARMATDESMITGASALLASLSMSPLESSASNGTNSSSHHERKKGEEFERRPPVRRVSRRKSYQTAASNASDYDDNEFADLDDY
jgi:hypothetical protein